MELPDPNSVAAFAEIAMDQQGRMSIKTSKNLAHVIYMLEQAKLHLLLDASKGDQAPPPPGIVIPNFLPKDLG